MNIWEIHPALVHFPIGLLLSAIALDLFAWWRVNAALNRVVTGLLIAGTAAGWLAANFGLLAFFTVPAHTDEAHTLMFWHMGVAASSLVLFTGLAVARWLHRAEPVKGLEHFVGLVAAAFLMITGALGGYIVYHGGAGVDPKLLAPEIREGHSHGDEKGKAPDKDMKETHHGEKDKTPDKDMKETHHGEKDKAPDKDMKETHHGEKDKAPDKDMKEKHHGEKDKAPDKVMKETHHGEKGKAPNKDMKEPHHGEKDKTPDKDMKEMDHGEKGEGGKQAAQKQKQEMKGMQHGAMKGKGREPQKWQETPKELPKVPPPDLKAAQVPAGYRVEVVLTDLTYPTSIEFDGDGTMYVAEGGYNYGDDVAPARVLRVASNGSRDVVAEQLSGPVTDLLWHAGRLFISHRGKISVLEGGTVRDLVTDLPSFGDHHNNQLTAGPDGKIYFGQGTATNSGVVGLDSFKMGWLSKHPTVRDIPAKDIRLRGEERGEGQIQEFETADPLAMFAEMKHGNGQKQDMAGMDYGGQNKPNGGKPEHKKQSAKASEFEANVQANRAKNQPSMVGMKGMDHGSGKMQGMQHGSKGNDGGKGMEGMDGEMAGMQPATTSAFQPFGKTAPKDGVVRGQVKANGTILRMDPDGSNLEVYAWGLRNPFGVMWGPDKKLYASDNGYDERGSRPIAHAPDLVWTVRQEGWYGFPDYAGDLPVTDPQFKPGSGPAPEFLMRDHPPIERPLATLKPHAGAAKIDFSRNPAFGFEGQMFLALVGDMNPITGQHDDRSGFEVIRVDPQTGETNTFFRTKENALGPQGMEYVATAGPKRPVDVRFSRDGETLYVVDIGAMAIVQTAIGPAPRPFPRTGVVWRIMRDEQP